MQIAQIIIKLLDFIQSLDVILEKIKRQFRNLFKKWKNYNNSFKIFQKYYID